MGLSLGKRDGVRRDGPSVLKVSIARGWMPPLKLVLKLGGTKRALIHRCAPHTHLGLC